MTTRLGIYGTFHGEEPVGRIQGSAREWEENHPEDVICKGPFAGQRAVSSAQPIQEVKRVELQKIWQQVAQAPSLAWRKPYRVFPVIKQVSWQ